MARRLGVVLGVAAAAVMMLEVSAAPAAAKYGPTSAHLALAPVVYPPGGFEDYHSVTVRGVVKMERSEANKLISTGAPCTLAAALAHQPCNKFYMRVSLWGEDTFSDDWLWPADSVLPYGAPRVQLYATSSGLAYSW